MFVCAFFVKIQRDKFVYTLRDMGIKYDLREISFCCAHVLVFLIIDLFLIGNIKLHSGYGRISSCPPSRRSFFKVRTKFSAADILAFHNT